MTEYEYEYEEEFDPSELVYIFYVQEVGVETTEYGVDKKNDRTYVDENRFDVEGGSSAYYYRLKTIKQDFDGADPKKITRESNEKLYQEVYNKIMTEFTDSKYNLYEDIVEELESQKTFKYCIGYNGEEYIVIFERF